jgi:hypothetical protein
VGCDVFHFEREITGGGRTFAGAGGGIGVRGEGGEGSGVRTAGPVGKPVSRWLRAGLDAGRYF